MPALAAIWPIIRALPWKWIALALAIVGLLVGVERHGKTVQREKDVKAIATLTGQRNGWRQNAMDQHAALAQQNAAVDAMKADADRRTRAAQVALAAADKRAAALQPTIDQLRASAAQKRPVGQECAFSEASKKVWSQ